MGVVLAEGVGEGGARGAALDEVARLSGPQEVRCFDGALAELMIAGRCDSRASRGSVCASAPGGVWDA